ncbi:MAG TPA: vitamin B12 dependent-methionine synthase activation domain-containing protein [Anaerolineae bacterium]|nr:vitamin B12 dependent-methionine synthase activation domain-containing protein [Anaerolineae bacterium]
MDAVVLDDIPFRIDLGLLMKKLHVREGHTYTDDVERLADEAQAIARPKALYKVAYIESRDDNAVVIDGITMNSRVLRVNLEQAHRVFPYVVTCGMELQEWADSIDDVLRRFWAETINEMALRVAIQVLNKHLAERYRPGRTSAMSPGSLGEWPIQAQRPLFALLGDPEEAIGVRLTDSLLMVPVKSVSGIRFPTEESFESCQLCPREGCPGRRAPYDKDLYDRKYRLETG